MTATTTCTTTGCITDHADDTTHHYPGGTVTDLHGKPQHISLAVTDNGEQLIGLGGHEFTPGGAIHAAYELLLNARLALRLQEGETAGLKGALLDHGINWTALEGLIELAGGAR